MPVVINRVMCKSCGQIVESTPETENKWTACRCGRIEISGGHKALLRKGYTSLMIDLSKAFDTELPFPIDKLYYLSMPLTTTGDIRENIAQTERIYNEIHKMGVSLIAPNLLVFPVNAERAMTRCIKLLSACDGIIVCGDWKRSQGCREELRFAKVNMLPIYEYCPDEGCSFHKLEEMPR